MSFWFKIQDSLTPCHFLEKVLSINIGPKTDALGLILTVIKPPQNSMIPIIIHSAGFALTKHCMPK